MAKELSNEQWAKLDPLIFDGKKLKFCMLFRTYHNVSLKRAIEALGERYTFLRKNYPEKFNPSIDEYWEGFYS